MTHPERTGSPGYTLAVQRADGSPVCAMASGTNRPALVHMLLAWRTRTECQLLILPTSQYPAHLAAYRARTARIGA